MKRILFVLIILCLAKGLHAQIPRTPYVYTIKADSVKITNTCDTAELIIENHTQTVPGFLFNKGRGRTEFRRINQFNDTSVVIGGDTIHLGRGYKNFANADLTYDGDHLHNGAFHSMNLTDFSNIGFKTNFADGTESAQMTMDPDQGYNLAVDWTGNPNKVRNSYMGISGQEHYSYVTTTTPDFLKGTQLDYSDSRADYMLTTSNLNTGTWVNTGIQMGMLTDYDPQEIDMISEDGTMRIYTRSYMNNTLIEMNFNRGDYLTTTCSKYGIGGSGISQTPHGFTFAAGGTTQSPYAMDFKLPGLPISNNSQDSVLVIDNSDGQVKKRGLSSLTPSLNITEVNIVDITAQPDAVTKLPNLQSHAGHSVSLPPAANYAGKKIYIWNQNASVNVWTFASSITLPDGSTSNVIPNQSTIELLSDGNVWLKWK